MDKKTITFFGLLIVLIFFFSIIQESSLTGKITWPFSRRTVSPTIQPTEVVYGGGIAGEPTVLTQTKLTCYASEEGKGRDCKGLPKESAKDWDNMKYEDWWIPPDIIRKARVKCLKQFAEKCGFEDYLDDKLSRITKCEILTEYGTSVKELKNEYCIVAIKCTITCPQTEEIDTAKFVPADETGTLRYVAPSTQTGYSDLS